jgi:hypothetical protein
MLSTWQIRDAAGLGSTVCEPNLLTALLKWWPTDGDYVHLLAQSVARGISALET